MLRSRWRLNSSDTLSGVGRCEHSEDENVNQVIPNKEAEALLSRQAKRIHDAALTWRQTPIRETATSRATHPSRFAIAEWWKDLEQVAGLPDLPTGIYKCQGNRCESASKTQNRNYGRDAVGVANDVLRLDKNKDARRWLADLSIDLDKTAPMNLTAWTVLEHHVRHSPARSKVGNLDQRLLRPALQVLFANTLRSEDSAERGAFFRWAYGGGNG